ncbi:MAG: nucleotidyltransferase domain-containing protein [Candidatus Gracilibacteria bacterium]|nr:nucleotidyltransferase domain-containing protein [Candidatus Gracilibacteria bacterium]
MKNNVLDFLKSDEVKSTLNKYSINHLYLFGSYSRGQETKGSDLDLLIEYDRSKYKITLFDLVKIEEYFKNTFGVSSVDFVTKKSIKPNLKKYIEKDLIKIY